jgi:secreted Zn-dependent insulinase-like peptidase
MFADAAAAQHPELHFPKTNEFIATDFTIFATPSPSSSEPSSASAEDNSMQLVGQMAQTESACVSASSSPSSSSSASSPFPAPPTLLAEDAGHRLWHKLDAVFCKPKLNVIIEMQTASASTTPRHEVLTALFSQLLQVPFVCAVSPTNTGWGWLFEYHRLSLPALMDSYGLCLLV